MPQPINQNDIKRYHDMIDRDKVQGAIRVYSELLGKGYDYAGWARGVAAGNTITGEAAILFMQESSGRKFSESELNAIRVDMAYGYLDVLQKSMQRTGQTQTDAKFRQIREFHERVFIRHGLKIENWTLEEPMRLLGKYGNGEETQDRVWNELARTQGDGVDAVAASAALYLTVADFAGGHIHVDKNGRYLPRPQPATPYNLPVYGHIRSIDAADRSLARRWLIDAAQWRSLSKTFAEAQDIAERQTQLAQNHFDRPVQAARPALTFGDMPEKAQELCKQCREHITQFYARGGRPLPYTPDEMDRISTLAGIAAYAEDMPSISDIHIEQNGTINIAYESWNEEFKHTAIETDKALAVPVEESIAQARQTEQDLARAAEQLAREIAEYNAPSYGRTL